ncbi:Putative teichuronic acid biosynthesis glycosyltransferase TuaH (fragment) [Candidatus Desulfarcum epimagneticum]|uniref:Teichuronic acid biosynthesis glycosyltransferase TuaH n=1 Tax=uncultured Desulfobacteraceae bacterium TaxID=218296 RepID=A0A484HEY3_9BACT
MSKKIKRFYINFLAAANILKRIFLRIIFEKATPFFTREGNENQNNAKYEEVKRSLHQNNGNLIVVFPVIDWKFRWQRPQQIVSRLSKRHFTVIYIAMSLLEKGRAYENAIDAGRDVATVGLQDHIYQIYLHSEGPLNIYADMPRGDNLENIYFGLASMLEEIRPQKIYYLIHFPGWSHVAYKLQENFGGKMVFDCMDDHSGFSTNTKEAIQGEEILIQKSNIVIVTSDILKEKANGLNPAVIQIKNGTEFEHFFSPVKNGALDHLGKSLVIGYHGAISDWFDTEIIEYCAREKTEWEYVLIGDTFGCDIKNCSRLSNVHFLGEKDYKQLPGYLAYFDVCVIPFKMISLTLATDPVKFYEYLSAGKPVVTVDLPELRPYGKVCYTASNKEEFLIKLEKAIEEKDDPALIERRISMAKENSWDSRVKALFSNGVF